MKALSMTAKSFFTATVVTMMLAVPHSVQAKGDHNQDDSIYQQRNLVSDGFVPAEQFDRPDPASPPKLVNSWGIAFNPFGPVWIADNGSGLSTLYNGDGIAQSLVVQIPKPTDPSGANPNLSGGNPTGIVFNGSSGFAVTDGVSSAASRFIFATEDGVIAGWAPNVPNVANVNSEQAFRGVDNSTTGAVYKGLALSAGALSPVNGGGSLLYAADFHNNKIDIFDSTFTPVSLPTGAFIDPSLPDGYAPFGLQAINGDIYVSYAKQDSDKHDDVKGIGFGFINVFDPNGRLIRRLASAGKLNAPWGMTLAPAGFGKYSGRLLVGNFGDGRINAFDLSNGEFVGQLKAADHTPIQIDGLWGIAFGNGFRNQPVDTLFFAAGPGDEAHGLYGRIDVAASTVDRKHQDRHHHKHENHQK